MGERWRPPHASRPHGRAQAARGQALVEFALVLPILAMLLLTVIDLGRLFYSQIAINNAAREGAFQASLPAIPEPDVPGGTFDSTHTWADPNACDTETDAVTCRTLLEFDSTPPNWFVHPAASDVTLTCSAGTAPPCPSGMDSFATVTVRTTFSLWSPWMAVFFGGNQNPTLIASSTSQVQTLPPPGTVPATPTPPPGPTPSPTPTPEPTSTSCTLPSAGFTATPVHGNAPLTVTVGDTSTFSPLCPITSWSWDWGDGSPHSTDPAPEPHVYGSRGSYHLTLTVTNAGGSNTSGKQTIVAN